MSTIYKWRSGQPSFNVNVTNIAPNNTGIKKVEINTSDPTAFTSNIVKHSEGGTAGASTYTGTITFTTNTLSKPISYFTYYNIIGTTVTWNSGGSYYNTTPHTITVCEPATSLKLAYYNTYYNEILPLDGTYIWSNINNINLDRSFSSSGTPYCSSSGTVQFVSHNTSYITINSNSYVTGTSASLVRDTTKQINKSYTVTISGASTSASIPDSPVIAAPITLTDTATITIKNAATNVSLSGRHTHIYCGQSSELTAGFNPHHKGTVYSTLINAGNSNPEAVSINDTYFPETNTNYSSLLIVGRGGGTSTISAYYSTDQIGIDGSTHYTIMCSSLIERQAYYTHIDGMGNMYCSYDAIGFVTEDFSPSSYYTSYYSYYVYAENETRGYYTTITYFGLAPGIAEIPMISGAEIEVICSSLTPSTTRNIYSSYFNSTSAFIPFDYDEVADSYGDTSYFTYFSGSSNESFGVHVNCEENITEHKTLVIQMRSGAEIIVNCYPAYVSTDNVELNVGDKISVNIGENDYPIEGESTGYYGIYRTTQNGSTLTITAKAVGSGIIKLASGLEIAVTVEDISVTVA